VREVTVAVFVLVHGAHVGGGAWGRVAARLCAAGHDVYAPTLTGLGERAHLASPGLGLGTHVADIVELLEYEDLSEIVLVGWSYGGMVVSGVADRVPGRLAHVVHLDAYCPRDGQSAADQQPPAYRVGHEERLRAGVWLAPPPAREEVTQHVDAGWLSAAEAQAILARFRPHPIKTLLEPLRLTNPAAAAVPRTYIACRRSPGAARRAAQQRVRPGWGYRELDGPHLAPLTHPNEVAALLLEVA
jgi:pimeloyl-ACP methyl ester carboxylesterase